MFFVYQYVDPRNGEPFYVGKGKGKRHLCHLKEATGEWNVDLSNPFKKRRIQEIIESGEKPTIIKLAKNLSEKEAFELEKYYIKRLRPV